MLISFNVELPNERTMGFGPEQVWKSTLCAFGADECEARMGQAVDHFVEVIFEAA